MKGKTLRVSCPAIFTWIETQLPNREEEINPAKRGTWKTLLEEFFGAKLNFTYNAFLSTGKDGKLGGGGTGFQLDNGTWIGVVGDVLNGRSDIGIVLGNTFQRSQKVSFSNSFYEPIHLTFVTTDGAIVFSPMSLLWPFNALMWFSIFLSTFLAFIVFKILTMAKNQLKPDEEYWGIELQMFFLTSTYLDQRCVLPKFTPLRSFVALWLFFILVITTIYRSKMVSLMVNPRTEIVPKTFKELSESDFGYGLMKHGDAIHTAIKKSKDTSFVKIGRYMDVIKGHGEECLERVVSRYNYACIGLDASIVNVAASNLSELETRQLVWALDSTFTLFTGIAFESGSIYKEGFDRWFGWMRAFHLQRRWEMREVKRVSLIAKDWFKEANKEEKLKITVNSEFLDLTLKHVSGSIYVLGIGFILSNVVFALEIVINRAIIKRTIKVTK